MTLLRRVDPAAVQPDRADAVDASALAIAARIVDDVREGGEVALRTHAARLGDLRPGEPLIFSREACGEAARSLPHDVQGVLARTAARIRAFALAQREGLRDLVFPVPGGEAGLRYAPVTVAGCYAPGGRYPLPSSVLMTAITARAAGVATVWVATPRPTAVTLAAAAVAEVDAVLAVGGAQAIGALAWGAGPVPACDAIVGPGNRWVAAAKQHVAGRVVIDTIAGPSELVVLADASADPDLVAADLLAQAEHDPLARPILVSTDPTLPDRVDAALAVQLATLPTAAVARAALENGFASVAPLSQAIAVCDRIAPEHLALHLADPGAVAPRLRHYGALFVGSRSAEVFGDYGAGPNHVLPTGGSARSAGALSVTTFLRAQTWLRLDDPSSLISDVAALARLEGLEGHARAADRRRSGAAQPSPGGAGAPA